jgi:hypothetical protein
MSAAPQFSSHLQAYPHHLQNLLLEVSRKQEARAFSMEESLYLARLFHRLEKTLVTTLWFLDGAEPRPATPRA